MKFQHYVQFGVIIFFIILVSFFFYQKSKVEREKLKSSTNILKSDIPRTDTTESVVGAIPYTPSPESLQKENEEYFSGWDGSNPEFVSAIKNSMNDPDSFEHVETRYNDKGDHLEIKMTYRGKNLYNATITNVSICEFDKSTRTISNIN